MILGSRNVWPVTLLLVIVFCTAGSAESASRLEYLDRVGFTVGSTDNPWRDYEIIIWQQQTATRLAGLARLGVTAGKIFGERGADGPDVARIPEETAPFRSLHLRWYIENIVTDFYSAYHRWQAGHPVNWLFDEAQRLHRQEPENLAAFVRSPSLSDPEWLHRAAQRLQRHVRAYAPLRPLYYSLADEPGIADLGAAWDFDLDPASLADMRVWLKRRYRTLAALNREWGTRFPEWGTVLPTRTDEAVHRSDENFSAWADFKEWMDIAFARAVRVGTDAVHAADSQARAALEGAQIPGWGGYDFSQLGGAVDVMEMYDSGNNVEISHSLFPKLITLSTAFSMDDQGAPAPHLAQIWWRFPKFVLGFLVTSIFVTWVTSSYSLADFNKLANPGLVAPIKDLRTWAFIFCFLSIGLTTRFRELAKAGTKPFVAFTSGVAVNVVLGFVLSAFVFAAHWSALGR